MERILETLKLGGCKLRGPCVTYYHVGGNETSSKKTLTQGKVE